MPWRVSQLRTTAAIALLAIAALLSALWLLSLARGFNVARQRIDTTPGSQVHQSVTRRWTFFSARGRIWLGYQHEEFRISTDAVRLPPDGLADRDLRRRYWFFSSGPAWTYGGDGWDAPRPFRLFGIDWINRPTRNPPPRGTRTGHERGIVIPYWLPIALAAAAGWYLDARRWPALWRLRRQRQGTCPHCGYDLRATPQRCPECGCDVAQCREEGEASR